MTRVGARPLGVVLLSLALAGPLILAGRAPRDGSLLGPVPPVAAAEGPCRVTVEPGAGTLTSCPDATTYEDLATGVATALGELRASAATAPLSVSSDPPGATVQLNGIDAGITPISTTVPPGSYVVRIAADGYQPYSTSVNVAVGKPGAVSATLASAEGGKGSFEWVRARTLIDAAGGYPTGSFEISEFVRDRDGAYWIAFVNTGTVTTELDRPPNPPLWFNVPTTLHTSVNVTGVARSTDNGATWTLVRSWRGSFFARGWTAEQLHDGSWDPVANGFPESFTDHKLTAYYTERRVEDYWIWNLVPRETGGVSVVLHSRNAHLPQELGMAWDNVGDGFDPGKYTGTLVSREPPGGKYASVASDEARAKWGAGADDLASYNWIEDGGDTVIDTAGAEGSLTVVGGPDRDAMTTPEFQATHEATDYFLAYGRRGTATADQGFIFASTDGDRTLRHETTFTIPNSLPEHSRANELRIGPDDTKYVVEHLNFGADSKSWRSSVYLLENGALKLLGQTPANLNLGVAGGNQFPYLSAAVDSAGNVHGAFRTGPSAQDNSTINVYYQYFPREPVSYRRVALMTQPSCTACDAARDFLTGAGVPFEENPADLPSDVVGSIASEVSSGGYPVVVRIGDQSAVRGGADAPTISRLLGVSHAVLVESHAPRGVGGSSGPLMLDPQWLLMIVENDQPRIVVDRRDGVVALAPAPGAWAPAPVMGVPASVVDTANITFSKRYPAFPAGGGTLSWSTLRDVRFNDVDRVADLAFLYHSGATSFPDWHGDPVTQFDYTLWTTESAPTSSDFGAIQEVSQLIPSGAFYVALGERGSPGRVSGELAGYVTSESEVTDGGMRFLRIVVDLRARGETATNGNIVGRAIAGQVTVDTEAEDETPETRDVALTLLVENTRLRAFHPGTHAFARDITNEAVHFTGDGEHWVVTNNIGLENSIPCGPDQSLLLEPFSRAKFTAETVGEFGIETCLAALEVAPTVLAECGTWEGAQLILAAETIHSLGMSLPIMRSEDVTNWEVAYGGRDATIHRIVTFDRPPPGDAGSAVCPSPPVEGSAAVVRLSGRFIGAGEVYRPSIQVVDRGATPVRTAPLTRPSELAWEREWLELESTFLQGMLKVRLSDERLVTFWFGGMRGRVDGYINDLLATRALLHCNAEGVGLAAVNRLIARNSRLPESLRGPIRCLQDFVVNPSKHWETYLPALWDLVKPNLNWIARINGSLVGNPTLAFLASSARGLTLDYGERMIAAAAHWAANDQSDPAHAGSFEQELSNYARVANAASREMTTPGDLLVRAILFGGDVERHSVRVVIDCVRDMPGDHPLARMIEITGEQKAYKAGIPCVDRRTGSEGKQLYFALVGIGVRSGTFGALADQAGRDLDLVESLFGHLLAALDRVAALEARYPAGTTAAAYRSNLPADERLLIALRQTQALRERRGHELKVGDLPAIGVGLTECGIGLIRSFWPDGVIILAATGAAVVAGPTAAAVGGVVFLTFGTVITGIGVQDIIEVWNGLDVAAKTSGACGVAVGLVMTAASVRPLGTAIRKAYFYEFPSDPLMLDPSTLPTRGRTAGLSLEEQAKATSRRGQKLVVDEPTLRPRGPDLEALLDAIPAAKHATIEALSDRLAYESIDLVTGERLMTPERQTVFELLATAFAEPDGAMQALHLRQSRLLTMIDEATANELAPAAPGGAEFAAWRDLGESMVFELNRTGMPKDIRVAGGPNGLVGSDAAQVRAALGDDFVPGHVEPGVGWVDEVAAIAKLELDPTPPMADIRAAEAMFKAYIESDRLAVDVESRGAAARALSPAAVDWLAKTFADARPNRLPLSTELQRVLGGTEIRTAILDALDREVTHSGGRPGARITNVKIERITSGLWKNTYRLTADVDGLAEPVQLAPKKGVYAPGELELMARNADLGLSQRPMLDTPVANVDGTEVFMIEQWLPGERGSPVPFGSPGTSGALGRLDALFALRTERVHGPDALLFDYDFGTRNAVYFRTAAGRVEALAVDRNPAMAVEATIPQNRAASLFGRANGTKEWVVPDFNEHLRDWLDAYATEPGTTPAAGRRDLAAAAASLRAVDQKSAPLLTLQFLEASRGANRDFDALMIDAANRIDAFLQALGPTSRLAPLPVPALPARWVMPIAA